MIRNTWRSAHDTNEGMSFDRSTEEAKICKHKAKDQESAQINWSGFRLQERQNCTQDMKEMPGFLRELPVENIISVVRWIPPGSGTCASWAPPEPPAD